MRNSKLTAVGLLLASSSVAVAGGMDRATYGTSVLFESGTYVDLSYASTSPSLTPDSVLGGLALNDGWDVGEDFSTIQANVKTDFSDKFSFALGLNNNPFGVDINYASFASSVAPGVAGLSSLRANLSSIALTAVGKYKVTDRVSAIAGLKYQTVSGSANVSVPLSAASIALGGGPVDGDVALQSDSATNFIVGASYEIPEIALRVAATYENEATFAPNVLAVNLGNFNTGAGEIKTPQVFNLEFQSGIAANTLAFGSIRHSKWSDAQVKMSAAFNNAQLSDFDDGTSYTLGIGRKFSDSISASLSINAEPGDGADASLLSPNGGSKAVSLGMKYTFDSGLNLSGGISHRVYDTATFYGSDGAAGGGDDIVFGGNSVTTFGLKLSQSF